MSNDRRFFASDISGHPTETFLAPPAPLTLADVIGRLNRQLEVAAERILPEADGTYYVTNTITGARIHSGVTVPELIEHARTLGVIGPEEEFTT